MEQERLNADGLAYSVRFADTMDTVIMPRLEECRTDRTVAGKDGVPLFVSRFDADGARGTVVMVHGFTESAEKFRELIHSLLKNGWSVVIYDQRGHGRSGRDPKISDISLVHVDQFEDYVLDLKLVCEEMLKNMPEHYVLFSHSMGGAVAARFLEEYPGLFSKAVFCAPMIACQRGGMPLFAANAVAGGSCLIGKGRKRIMMSRPFAGPEDFETSDTNSRERFDWYDHMRCTVPEFSTNGPTYCWTREALRVTKKILAPGAVEKITIPVRVYGAETDHEVLPEQQEEFAERLKNGSRRVVAGAKHEIYRCRDEILFPWWHEILDFLA